MIMQFLCKQKYGIYVAYSFPRVNVMHLEEFARQFV